jgi:hypothetical protein
MSDYYNSTEWKDEKLIAKFNLQLKDSKDYFLAVIKPRNDRFYKLYCNDVTDRARELMKGGKSWMSNIGVPYVFGVIESFLPRCLDARPDFSVSARKAKDQGKCNKLEGLNDYTWEIGKMDSVMESVVKSSAIYGNGYAQVGWKKDEREHEFLSSKGILGKLVWKKKKQVFYDAPVMEYVDNYLLWYDWHNVAWESKQYFFKRLILSGAVIKKKYPYADKKRLALALKGPNGDLTNYADVRITTKTEHERITKGAEYNSEGIKLDYSVSNNQDDDEDNKMFEVFEWWRPFEDKFAVMVGGNYIPILKNGEMPNPYDFKDTPFINIPYTVIPGESEAYGIPAILESGQIMLNMIKNQRLDAMILNIHKMWIVNPLANIDKRDLVTRPFGIIYSLDPNGAREIQTAGIDASAYREEDLLKADMRLGSGIDDSSMGQGGSSGSATEIRHLRESTLERVRMFSNHLGDGLSIAMRYFISMYRQFWTKKFEIRVVGESGKNEYPIVEKDDLEGYFDFKATVIPSIAGKEEIRRKQDMDLLQLVLNPMFPNIDAEKVLGKILIDWKWDIEDIKKEMEPVAQEMEAESQGEMLSSAEPGGGVIPSDVLSSALSMIGDNRETFGEQVGDNPMQELQNPIDLVQRGTEVSPPTVNDTTSNRQGINSPGRQGGVANRTGKVNTNVSTSPRANSDVASRQVSQANNIQR